MTSDIKQRISLYKLEIDTLHNDIHKRSLKAKSENSNCVVTRNISKFCRLPKDAVFLIAHLMNYMVTLNIADTTAITITITGTIPLLICFYI